MKTTILTLLTVLGLMNEAHAQTPLINQSSQVLRSTDPVKGLRLKVYAMECATCTIDGNLNLVGGSITVPSGVLSIATAPTSPILRTAYVDVSGSPKLGLGVQPTSAITLVSGSTMTGTNLSISPSGASAPGINVSSAGWVGLGTGSPLTRLDVIDNGNGGLLGGSFMGRFVATSANANGHVLGVHCKDSTGICGVYISTASDSTIGQSDPAAMLRIDPTSAGTPIQLTHTKASGVALNISSGGVVSFQAAGSAGGVVGVSTANPAGSLSVARTGQNAASYIFQASSGSLTTAMGVTQSGRTVTEGQLVTANQGTISAGSNDMRGSVTFTGGAMSSATITFKGAGGLTTPICTCSDTNPTPVAVGCTPGPGTLDVTIAVAANDTINYICAW